MPFFTSISKSFIPLFNSIIFFYILSINASASFSFLSHSYRLPPNKSLINYSTYYSFYAINSLNYFKSYFIPVNLDISINYLYMCFRLSIVTIFYPNKSKSSVIFISNSLYSSISYYLFYYLSFNYNTSLSSY
jgi:hypothetical protein